MEAYKQLNAFLLSFLRTLLIFVSYVAADVRPLVAIGSDNREYFKKSLFMRFVFGIGKICMGDRELAVMLILVKKINKERQVSTDRYV